MFSASLLQEYKNLILDNFNNYFKIPNLVLNTVLVNIKLLMFFDLCAKTDVSCDNSFLKQTSFPSFCRSKTSLFSFLTCRHFMKFQKATKFRRDSHKIFAPHVKYELARLVNNFFRARKRN